MCMNVIRNMRSDKKGEMVYKYTGTQNYTLKFAPETHVPKKKSVDSKLFYAKQICLNRIYIYIYNNRAEKIFREC